jgi:hypothetical protein
MACVFFVTFSKRAKRHTVSRRLDVARQFLQRFYVVSMPESFSRPAISATPAHATGRNQIQALALFRPINTAPL